MLFDIKELAFNRVKGHVQKTVRVAVLRGVKRPSRPFYNLQSILGKDQHKQLRHHDTELHCLLMAFAEKILPRQNIQSQVIQCRRPSCYCTLLPMP